MGSLSIPPQWVTYVRRGVTDEPPAPTLVEKLIKAGLVTRGSDKSKKISETGIIGQAVDQPYHKHPMPKRVEQLIQRGLITRGPETPNQTAQARAQSAAEKGNTGAAGDEIFISSGSESSDDDDEDMES